MIITNSAAYRFIELAATTLSTLQDSLRQTAQQLSLKGTILLSREGINLCVSGTHPAILQFKHYVEGIDTLSGLRYQDTYSTYQPFQKLLIKIKKQIIPYTDSHIDMTTASAPYITPKTLYTWLNNKQDVVLLDARNQYEVDAGSFKQALHLSLKQFKDFPAQAEALHPSLKQKTVVTFCTGGIRCEKASKTLLDQGFLNVYQLKGGIVNYFKTHGTAHYEGGCFVFDTRAVIRPNALLQTI